MEYQELTHIHVENHEIYLKKKAFMQSISFV